MPTLESRREAGNLSRQQLTPPQQLVVDEAMSILENLASEGQEEPGGHPSLSFLPEIAPPRRSTILLIEGKRGAGKSTAALTLMAELNKRCIAAMESPNSKNRPLLVPFSILDMSPIRGDADLAMYLSANLLDVLEWIEDQRRNRSDRRAKSPDSPKELPSRAAWRKLTNCLGATSPLRKISTEADADQVAWSLEIGERARVRLAGLFRAFMDHLSTDFRECCGSLCKPLFIVTIDDADMNLGRAVELLELVRALYHPNLCFILAGSSDQFLIELRTHYMRELFWGGAREERLEIGSDRMPLELASAVFDKIIPAGNRLQLRGLSYHEILNHREFPIEILSSISMALSMYREMAKFLEAAPALQIAIPALPREIVDIFNQLSRAQTDDEKLQILWREAVQKSDLLLGQKNQLLARWPVADRGRLNGLTVYPINRTSQARPPSLGRQYIVCTEPYFRVSMRNEADLPERVGATAMVIAAAAGWSPPWMSLLLVVRQDGLQFRVPTPRWPGVDIFFDFAQRWTATAHGVRKNVGDLLGRRYLAEIFRTALLEMQRRAPARADAQLEKVRTYLETIVGQLEAELFDGSISDAKLAELMLFVEERRDFPVLETVVHWLRSSAEDVNFPEFDFLQPIFNFQSQDRRPKRRELVSDALKRRNGSSPSKALVDETIHAIDAEVTASKELRAHRMMFEGLSRLEEHDET